MAFDGTLKKMYSLAELEKILGVTHRTLLTWVNNGTLRAAKIGRSWRVAEDDVQKYIESHTKQ